MLVIEAKKAKFLKLTRQGTPQYGRSYPLSIYRGDDIYSTVKGLKLIRELVV
ncbi:hypothetical protein RIVM261_025640 [Rivularia sp. IAM M-261]|nr:hypothetical protein CAL7716_020890 [Calothrix sp. PCC 7716]GJD17608.1 hypothetical protein RIVM261_025640 [Rivularia sp. IAM M-261]